MRGLKQLSKYTPKIPFFTRSTVARNMTEYVETGNATSSEMDQFNRAESLRDSAKQILLAFSQRRNPQYLDQAITKFSEALSVLPTRTDVTTFRDARWRHLYNTSHALWLRIEVSGSTEDLGRIVEYLHEALYLCLPTEQLRLRLLDLLIRALRVRYDLEERDADNEEILSLLQETLKLDPVRNANFDTAISLAIGSTARSAISGRAQDLESAKFWALRSSQLQSTDAQVFMVRERLGEVLLRQPISSSSTETLDDAISWIRKTVEGCPVDAPLFPQVLEQLKTALLARFGVNHNTDDCDELIFQSQRVIDHQQGKSEDAFWVLTFDIAHTYLKRFTASRDIGDIDTAVSMLHKLQASFPSHPKLVRIHQALQDAHRVRFGVSRDLNDMDEAMRRYNEEIRLLPSEYEPWEIHHTRGGMLMERFKVSMDREDIRQAVSTLQAAIEDRTVNESDLWRVKHDLAEALSLRSKVTRKVEDLDEALRIHREAVESSPDPQHADLFIALAKILNARFKCAKEDRYLDEELQTINRGLSLEQCTPILRATLLSRLATALASKFDVSRNIKHLDGAIKRHKEALQLFEGSVSTPDPDFTTALTEYANSLEIKFDFTGDDKLLDKAIKIRVRAFENSPAYLRYACLHAIGCTHRARFSIRRFKGDLDSAIEAHRKALALLVPAHPDRWKSLMFLGLALDGDSSDADRRTEAMDCFRQALDQCGNDNVLYQSYLLSEIASSLIAGPRYTTDDCDNAIDVLEQAISLNSSAQRSIIWNRVGNTYRLRFLQSREPEDLRQSIRSFKEEAELLPPDHPRCGGNLSGLARTHLLEDPPTADPFALFRQAATHRTSSIRSRIECTLEWAMEARRQHPHHSSTLEAYSHLLSLLDQYITQYPTAELQRQVLAHMPPSIASDACSAAVEAGCLETAVGLLEQGRGLVWARLTRLRHPISALKEVDKELASEFKHASRELERLATSSMTGISPIGAPSLSMSVLEGDIVLPADEQGAASDPQILLDAPYSPVGSSQQLDVDGQMQLVKDASARWDSVVSRIRDIKGFADFLRAVPFSELRKAAADGAVVIVNVSEYRCDAIIIQDPCTPVIVHLPDATPSGFRELSQTLDKNLEELHSLDPDAREAKKAIFYRGQIKTLLRTLWSCVVQPVVEKLEELQYQHGSRLWWYPTGPLCRLPLHAAGPYKSGKNNLHDIYISSYITTLSRTLESRRLNRPDSQRQPNMLVVGVPGDEATDPDFLPNVEEEVRNIRSVVTSEGSRSLKIFVGELATPNTVLTSLPQYSWVHLTCHGYQDPRPYASSFQLHNKEQMRLLELVQAHLSKAELAVLSACNTATGDVENAPDEVIHLAAAMQFCGFRSVVGTLWPMKDEDGPNIALEFYGYMFRQGQGHAPDFRDSAAALNHAVKSLQRAKVPIDRWINFVHFGL